jgi:hypothetical protein
MKDWTILSATFLANRLNLTIKRDTTILVVRNMPATGNQADTMHQAEQETTKPLGRVTKIYNMRRMNPK